MGAIRVVVSFLFVPWGVLAVVKLLLVAHGHLRQLEATYLGHRQLIFIQ